MKKFKAVIVVSLIIVLGTLLLTGCKKVEPLDTDEIEKIVAWTQTDEYELRQDEIERIVELYNLSKHGGEPTGEGGTPQFGIRIYLNNGKVINVNDFSANDKDFEAFICDSANQKTDEYYIINKELYMYLSSILADISIEINDGIVHFHSNHVTPDIFLLGEKEIKIENQTESLYNKLINIIANKTIINDHCNCSFLYKIRIDKYIFALHSHSIEIHEVENDASGEITYLGMVSCEEAVMDEIFNIIAPMNDN